MPPEIVKEIINKSTTTNSSTDGDIESEFKKMDSDRIVKDKRASSEPPSSLYPYPYGSWPY
uniref:Candidate secreted effector n=1 Tax=Meloidogyne incognita TaxID=6306 RepID=A0A914MMT8_MELIC